MDSSLNYRHAQVHGAELSRRAELHRLAAQARAAKQDRTPERPALLAPPALTERVYALMARLRHQAAATSGRP